MASGAFTHVYLEAMEESENPSCQSEKAGSKLSKGL
jgi:hypothetical protein